MGSLRLFFSTYTLLVLFWAEIYHQARSLPIDRLKPTYLTINGIVYFIQASGYTHSFSNFLFCLWAYVKQSANPVAVDVAKLFFAGWLCNGDMLHLFLDKMICVEELYL
ncbi:hypothetical protein AAC387_Pa08g0635 [Persea americana]